MKSTSNLNPFWILSKDYSEPDPYQFLSSNYGSIFIEFYSDQAWMHDFS